MSCRKIAHFCLEKKLHVNSGDLGMSHCQVRLPEGIHYIPEHETPKCHMFETGIAGFWTKPYMFLAGRRRTDHTLGGLVFQNPSDSQDGDRRISMDNRRLYAFRMAFDDDNYKVA